jgi:hypothetical protein
MSGAVRAAVQRAGTEEEAVLEARLGGLRVESGPCRGDVVNSTQQTGGRRLGDPAEIVLDPEFQNLSLEPATDEEKQMVEELALRGCVEPLMVWPTGSRLVLVTGYDVFPFLRHYGVEFWVIEERFTTRDAARMYVIRHQVAKRNIPPLGVSYLRGLRYLAEKQPHGGDRHAPRADAMGLQKTADALGEIFHVSPATIRRDGAFAGAVETILATCGRDVRPLLIGRDARLSRQRIVDIAKLQPEGQRDAMWRLGMNGRLGRGWRNNGEPLSLTLPRGDMRAMAEVMIKRLGMEATSGFLSVLIDVLAEREKQGTPART